MYSNVCKLFYVCFDIAYTGITNCWKIFGHIFQWCIWKINPLLHSLSFIGCVDNYVILPCIPKNIDVQTHETLLNIYKLPSTSFSNWLIKIKYSYLWLLVNFICFFGERLFTICFMNYCTYKWNNLALHPNWIQYNYICIF